MIKSTIILVLTLLAVLIVVGTVTVAFHLNSTAAILFGALMGGSAGVFAAYLDNN
jgi:hypothetical protein